MTFDQRVNWAKGNRVGFLQSMVEFKQLYSIMERKSPFKNILEIGSFCGGSLYTFAGCCENNANIITIDPELKPKLEMILNELRKDFNVFHIKKKSQEEGCFEEVTNITKQLDFLFIDGDHSYKGVKADYEKYAPLVNPGGIIVIHDICGAVCSFPYEVKKFWNELKENGLSSYEELIENPKVYGIGVIYANL